MMSATILTDIVEELEDTSQNFRHRNVHHNSSIDPDPRNVQQFQRYRSHRTAQALPSPGTRPTPPRRGSRSTSRDQHPPTIPHVGPTPTTAATVRSRNSANINRNSHDSRHCRLDSLPPHRQNFCIENITSSQRVRMSPMQHQQSTRHPNHRLATTTMNTSARLSGSPIHTSYQAHTLPAPQPRRGIRTTHRKYDARQSSGYRRSSQGKDRDWDKKDSCKKGMFGSAMAFLVALVLGKLID